MLNRLLLSPVNCLFAYLSAIVVALYLYWGPLTVRIKSLFEAYSFNGDALQHIAPFWRAFDPTLLQHDYVITYYQQALLPFLFRWFYEVLMIFTYPTQGARIVTSMLSVLFITLSTMTACRLAGRIASIATFFLVLGGVLKNFYFLGGIQRGFGFCITSAGLLAITSGNVSWIALLSVLAMPLYPAASVLLYTVLTLILLFCRPEYRGSATAWSFQKRLMILTATGIACGCMAIPQMLGGMQYGERLSISAESEYEEWGGNGRYTQGDRGVPTGFLKDVLSVTTANILAERISGSRRKSADEKDTLSSRLGLLPEQQRVILFILTSLLGILAYLYHKGPVSGPVVRLTFFTLGIGVTYGLATVMFPLLYIPSRYTTIGITSLVSVVFPAIWTHGSYTLTKNFVPSVRHIFSILTCIFIFIFLGWTNLPPQPVPSAAGNMPLFAHLRSLPKDSIIAAWPRGIASMIPLFSARSVLVYEEGHQIFHRDFLEEMRRRTRAIISAYSATDRTPFEELRTTFGVTHMLVDKRHLSKAPTYFQPFKREMRSAREKMSSSELFLIKLLERGKDFEFGNLILIDLQRAGIHKVNSEPDHAEILTSPTGRR